MSLEELQKAISNLKQAKRDYDRAMETYQMLVTMTEGEPNRMRSALVQIAGLDVSCTAEEVLPIFKLSLDRQRAYMQESATAIGVEL